MLAVWETLGHPARYCSNLPNTYKENHQPAKTANNLSAVIVDKVEQHAATRNDQLYTNKIASVSTAKNPNAAIKKK